MAASNRIKANWKTVIMALFIVSSLVVYWSVRGDIPLLKLITLFSSDDECYNGAILRGIEPGTSVRNVINTTEVDLLKMHFHSLVTSVDDGAKLCPNIARFGRAGDGGYDVCLTPPFKPEPGNCLVYSFGINGDWSFDEAIADYNCEVHSFDPSMGLQDHLHTPKIHFHNLGLWGEDFVNNCNWTLKSLSSIRRRLGHEKRPIDILKVDVEGAEWPFLYDVTIRDPDQLSDVRQLVIELHTPRYRPTPVNHVDLVEVIDYINRLLTIGGGRFVVHRNRQVNYCCGGYSPLMPPHVAEKCCHEVFLLNTRFMKKT